MLQTRPKFLKTTLVPALAEVLTFKVSCAVAYEGPPVPGFLKHPIALLLGVLHSV
jgi:hypothetical protein